MFSFRNPFSRRFNLPKMEREHLGLLLHLQTLNESLTTLLKSHLNTLLIQQCNGDIETPAQQAKRETQESKEVFTIETKIQEVMGEAEELRILIEYTERKRAEEEKEKEMVGLERELEIARAKYIEMISRFQEGSGAVKDARWAAFQTRESLEAGCCGCKVRCGVKECPKMTKSWDAAYAKALEAGREMQSTMSLLEKADEELKLAEEKARVGGLDEERAEWRMDIFEA